jgi:hypothetical protein
VAKKRGYFKEVLSMSFIKDDMLGENEREQWGFYLKRTYGLTIKEYEAMLTGQGGVCRICKPPPPKGGKLHVDHDHNTGKVRGLLCRNCNHGLGNFKDNPFLLIEAYKYLGYK